MVDNVKLFVPRTVLNDLPVASEQSFTWRKIEFKPHYRRKRLVYMKGDDFNLHFTINPRGLQVHNSLHFYANQNNHSLLTVNDLARAVTELCGLLGVKPSDVQVKRVEIGANIRMDQEMVDRFMAPCHYKFKEPAPMLHRTRRYGTKFYLSKYRIKVYDKRFETWRHHHEEIPSTLRVEFESNSPRSDFGVVTLGDLVLRSSFNAFKRVLYRAVASLVFQYPAPKELTLKERCLYYAGQSSAFWMNEKQLFPAAAKKVKRKYTSIVKSYGSAPNRLISEGLESTVQQSFPSTD